jgi:pimeloyl-ACP methyl ester carboxylesterase
VAPLLRAAGHDVHTPTLTGLGERAHLLRPGIDLDTHIEDVVAVLHYEDLRDVILVGHSYGGMVITGVADRALDRVGHLVYLDAANPVGGESLADIAAPLMQAARAQGKVVDGVELVLFPGTEPLPDYGVTDPDDVAWMAERLIPHPYACFEQPLRLEREADVWALPQTQNRLHVDAGGTRPRPHGGRPRRRPRLGRRHRPRPHDHRARRDRRTPPARGRGLKPATAVVVRARRSRSLPGGRGQGQPSWYPTHAGSPDCMPVTRSSKTRAP